MKPKLWKTDEETFQLAMLIREYFDVFNIYGRPTSAVSNIVKRFDASLEEYTLESIKEAFAEYEKTNDAFPVPAAIIRIIEDPQEWNYTAIKAIEEKKKTGSPTTAYEDTYIKEASKPNKAKYAPKPTAAPTSNYHMDLEEQLNASPINRKILGMFAKDDFYRSYVQGTHANFTDLGNNELRLTLLRSKDKFLEHYESFINKAGYTIKEVLVTS